VAVRDHAEPFRSVKERHDYAVLPGRLYQEKAIAGDGMRLPFPDAIADIAFSSNVLEHVPDPRRFIEEAIRVTKPNGTIYLSFTVWRSPWGGHETSPWHFLGGERAARRYERKHGHPPGNLFGTSLFAYSVKEVMAIVREQPNLAKVTALPRYYPDWMRWVIRVPVLREYLTWNLLVVMRKDIDR
jgi:SAM-dependent methyltransferase